MPKQNRQKRSLEDLDPSQGIALFTDGSAWSKDHSGGWAWLAIDCAGGLTEASGSVSETTNNRMEMTAWIEGLVAIEATLGPCEILVYSDSEYVGLGVMYRHRNRKANKDLWDQLDEATAAHKYVEFVHVRGHTGHVYNERVDKLASAARRKLT